MMPELTAAFLQSQGLSITVVERFWNYVFILPYDRGCWFWIGGTDHNGYGVIGKGSKNSGMISAHRISWMIHYGPLPKGQPLLHSCDTPTCVRPEHLTPGTQAENVADMIRKNRIARGEDRGHAKLTWAKIEVIRQLGGWSYSQLYLARRFGVSVKTIQNVLEQKTWKSEFHPISPQSNQFAPTDRQCQ